MICEASCVSPSVEWASHFAWATFQTTLAPDPSRLVSLRAALRAWLEEVGVADPPRSELVLATHEAAANAIEHAASSSPIEIRARRAADHLVVEIRGSWTLATTATRERRARPRPEDDRGPRLRGQDRNRRERHHAPAAAKDLSEAGLPGSQLRWAGRARPGDTPPFRSTASSRSLMLERKRAGSRADHLGRPRPSGCRDLQSLDPQPS